ncbi:MAG TPA: PQQ-dependent sugar dehydrogenase [Terriglobales bacterium]|jgi:glucose/arabinose dehydrogenase|nr:PQQ-dependent sugar dehydrogenase [Terriglobales bacterium]
MSRRTPFPLTALISLTLFLAACGGSSNSTPPPPPPPPPTLTLTTVVSGLSGPLDLERPPGDNRFFVVEQRGTIRIIENGALLAGNFLDIESLTNFDGAEQGLLGLAFHPNYSTNRLFYVNYTSSSGGLHTVIAEFQTLAGNPNQADPSSQRILLTVAQPFSNHKGGQLAFGPDHFLYLGLGDGGSGGDPLGNGQNVNVLLGKILRIGVDPPFTGGLQYAIPTDNPFSSGGGSPEIWAYGLRNPWRFSFERGGTRLFAGDVGQDKWEEVDLITKGGNFGWNVMEGNHCFNPSTGCDTSGKIAPIAEYSHSEGIAIIGGYVYKGTISGLANAYIFADLTGKIWSLTEAPANTWTRTLLLSTGRTISSFGQDAAGEVYVVDLGGSVLKLAAQ